MATTKDQALKTFGELQTEALTEHAMRVYADPKSAPEHRQAAKAYLLSPTAEQRTRHLETITNAELGEYQRIAAKMRGEDTNGDPLPQDDRSRRSRAQNDVLAIASDLSRARAFCRKVWAETGATWAVAARCDECHAECLNCGPNADKHRQELALIAAVKMTPHERRKVMAEADGPEFSESADVDSENIPPQPLVTQPFNMPVVEPVEPSAADFIELDGVPSRGAPVVPRDNRRLSDAELAEHDPDRAELIRDAKTAQFWEQWKRSGRRL